MIIKPLPIVFSTGEMQFTIYPVLLKEGAVLTLVDCGYPGDLPKIEAAFKEAGEDITALQNVLLTHHDHDHMGAVKALVKKYPKVQVFASREQIPYLLGQKKSLRLEQQERLGAPSDFLAMIRSVEYIEKVSPIWDGEVLPTMEGVTVLQTDGHMPGHLSFYIEEKRTLISGDALICDRGQLKIADSSFVLDQEKEIQSLRKLLKYNIDEVICYHGGVYRSPDIHGDLTKIIETGYSAIESVSYTK